MDEREENRRYRKFIQREVYTQYCRYTEVICSLQAEEKRKNIEGI